MSAAVRPETLTRAEQVELARELLREANELGYAKVAIEVTRGGTLRVEGERAGEAKMGHGFTTGRKR